MSDRVKLVQSLSNYLLPKAKTVRDKFTLEELQEREKLSWAENKKGQISKNMSLSRVVETPRIELGSKQAAQMLSTYVVFV